MLREEGTCQLLISYRAELCFYYKIQSFHSSSYPLPSCVTLIGWNWRVGPPNLIPQCGTVAAHCSIRGLAQCGGQISHNLRCDCLINLYSEP